MVDCADCSFSCSFGRRAFLVAGIGLGALYLHDFLRYDYPHQQSVPIYMDIPQPENIIRAAFLRHRDAVARSIEELFPAVEAAASSLAETLKNGGKILACGNGGSAADAQHFAAEFVCRYKDDRAAFPAIALTTDTSALTAIGNDYGFDEIFSRQVSALGRGGDVLVAFTTSGISLNVLAAIRAAKEKKMRVIILTGEGGKKLSEMADVLVAVPSDETARIQEIHELIFHGWCEFVDHSFEESRS